MYHYTELFTILYILHGHLKAGIRKKNGRCVPLLPLATIPFVFLVYLYICRGLASQQLLKVKVEQCIAEREHQPAFDGNRLQTRNDHLQTPTSTLRSIHEMYIQVGKQVQHPSISGRIQSFKRKKSNLWLLIFSFQVSYTCH